MYFLSFSDASLESSDTLCYIWNTHRSQKISRCQAGLGVSQGREMEQSGIKYYREIMVQEGFKGEGDKGAR